MLDRRITISKIVHSPAIGGTFVLYWRCKNSTGDWNLISDNVQVNPDGTLITPVTVDYSSAECTEGITIEAAPSCGVAFYPEDINITTTTTTTTSTTTTTTIPSLPPDCAVIIGVNGTVQGTAPTTTTTTTTSSTTTTTTCACDTGYTAKPDGSGCVKEETCSGCLTTIHSGYCFAPSVLSNNYAIYGTKLYNAGYTTQLVGAYTLLSTVPEWLNTSGTLTGPFNRRGIWVDTDCDGVKDPLTAGSHIEITIPIIISEPKTVYIGIGGDNTFKVVLNNEVGSTTIVSVTSTSPAGGNTNPPTENFRYWHLFPVNLLAGTNYLNFSAVGDGSTNDAFAAAIYDNTSAELSAATDDSQLNILFDTADLVGTSLDIATCSSGWFLDTSGGAGSYTCKRVLTLNCGELAPTTTSTTTTTTSP
jgi:hypothetical protein